MDDAWASVGAFTIGHRFSFFDYNPGFTYKPGYTSYRTTNVLAWSSPIYDGVSATFALEDGTYRRREDGVWASYRDKRAPDFVASVNVERPWGNAHASFAAHGLSREDTLGCSCSGEAKDVGLAASAGVEYRHKFGDTYGRIMLSGAASEGALDYLGIPSFAPDYIADSEGQIRRTRGYSAIASYEHVWLPTLRTSASFSVYATSNAGDDFQWNSTGYLGQLTIEFMPVAKVVLGAELSRFFDAIRGTEDGFAGSREHGTTDRF